VQTVFVVVRRTVDVEVEISMRVVEPVVCVSVTGQSVVVVSTTTVVMTSLAGGVYIGGEVVTDEVVMAALDLDVGDSP
jgi:hypothetical protein